MEDTSFGKRVQFAVDLVKNSPGMLNSFLLSRLANELVSLKNEPWMSEDDLDYVGKVQLSLEEGKYDDLLKKALRTTAICALFNNAPYALSMVGSAALSALSGEDIATASLKSIGVGATTAIISQAVSTAIILASYPPKSLSDLPLSAAIVSPSLVLLPVPGHTIAANLLASLTLQKPEEFLRLTQIEAKRIGYYLKGGLLAIAGQYKGIM